MRSECRSFSVNLTFSVSTFACEKIISIMRKKLFISSLMTLLSLLPVHAQGGLRPRGDIDCDWEVTIADANALIEAIMKGTPYHAFYTYALDVNSDKEINIADLNMLTDGLLGSDMPPMPNYSGTLPILFINTENHCDIVSKEEYVNACWWLDAMGIEGCESVGSAEEPFGMLIKGHGHYTWTDCDKKSLRLKFNEKHKVLGIPSSRHWVLKANALNWKGKIEDALPFEIGRRMGLAWTPRQEPVEVVLNGQYIGMYFLLEKINVSKNRVNIVEQKDNETDLTKVTGGWLLEIDNYWEPGQIIIDDNNDGVIRFTPHSPELLSDVQRNYITAFLDATDDAIAAEDKADTSWEQYIDIDSLAIYYLVQEVVDNQEAFSGSCYMHKEHGDNTKLIFGPLWDCDHSFFRYGNGYYFNKFIYEDLPSNWHSIWIGEIAKFPRFQERVRAYWNTFYTTVYPEMDGFMDSWAARIEEAGNADFVRWPQYNGNNTTQRLNAYGKKAFHQKVEWLNSQWSTQQPSNDAPGFNQKK